MIQHRAGFRIFPATIAAVVLALFATLPARADIIIDWPEIVVPSDGVNPVNGFADIFITLTGADLLSPPSIDAFNLRFDVVSGVGLTFGTPQNAVVNPLFPNTNFFAAGTYPSTTVEAANDGTGVVLANGKGLIRSPFTAPGNGQTYTISINTQDTQLSYQGNAFNFVASGGSVTVQAVPEPAAIFGMGVVALVSAAGAVATRRKLART